MRCHRRGEAACRPAARRRPRRGIDRRSGRAATASRPRGSTSGASCSRPFTTRWHTHAGHRTMTLLDALLKRPLLGDGAMGTQLMIAGLEQGNCGEAWNLTHPERVLAIQRRYAEAGSDCILTNTFGGIAHHAQPPRSRATTSSRSTRPAWPSRARRSADATGYVIGDIGPFGGLMEPYGDFTEDAGARRVRRAGAGARRRRRRRDHHRDADVARGAAARHRGGAGSGRGVRHRVDGVRRHARRLDVPHDDGDRSGAGGGVHAGARRRTSSR